MSPATHRLQKLRGLCRVPQGSADFADAHGKSRLTYGGECPYCVNELVFGDELAGVGHKIAQYSKGFSRQPHCLRVPPQALGTQVETKRRKHQDACISHAPLSPRQSCGMVWARRKILPISSKDLREIF